MTNITNAALLIRLEAKPGSRTIAECFHSALTTAQAESATTVWFEDRMGFSPLGVVDAFPHQAGREIHLQDRIVAAMLAKDHELFAQPPAIEMIGVLTSKLHG
jgi:hypothetical protein